MRSKKYFGAEKEKLDKYQMLKNTSIDAFKFYIVTIIVLFLLTIAERVDIFTDHGYLPIKVSHILLLHFTWFLAVILTQLDLRGQFKRTLLP